MSKNEFISYLKSVSLIVSAFLFLVFPSFFLTVTSDSFIVPKQIFVVISAIVLFALFLTRTIAEGKITLRSTPFNLPVLLFGIAVLVSSVFSSNVYDSIFQAVPVFALVLMYFSLINFIEDKMSFKLLLYSIVFGVAISSLITVLYHFKIYIFPFQGTQVQNFNTFGAPIQQIIYSLPVLLISVFHLMNFKKSRVINYDLIIFAVASVFTVASSVLVMYQIFTLQQGLVMLPYVYGFQIALASISQDAQRLLQSFLFGSGYGTFVTDFTRFKLLSINLDKNIWNVIFSYSSSYFLELLATTGVFGIASFLFLMIKSVKTRPAKPNVFYVSILVIFFVSFILPLSYSVLFLLFSLIGLYSSYLYLEKSHYVENVTVTLVALRQGLINFELTETHKKSESRALPIIISAVVLIILAFIGYSTVRFVTSDIKFRESLLMVAQNNGQDAYRLQAEAIQDFPYRSDYYRFFSQLNLALATSLAATLPQDPAQANTETAQKTRQTVLTLIQQSITSARTSVLYSPMSVVNWQNMAQVYRSLINVGQNAEQFTVASLQQAISLDPYNPQLYVELGGVYYQLGNYELAQNQFQLAVGLKRDFANGYYNLGHALEAKGDLASALTQYQTVRNLVAKDQASLDKMNAEITALESKIGQKTQETQTAQVPETPAENQPPLELNQPESSLPPQKPPVKIPEPPTTVTPSPAPTGAVTPSPEQ